MSLTIAAHTELDRSEWGVDTIKLGRGVHVDLDITAVHRSSGDEAGLG